MSTLYVMNQNWHQTERAPKSRENHAIYLSSPPQDNESSTVNFIRERIKITSDIFFDIFPFIIVFNRGMRIRNVGIALVRLIPNMVGKKFSQEFVLMRPFIRLRWEEVRKHLILLFGKLELWKVEQETQPISLK